MPTKHDFRAAQERIFARPRLASKSDEELLRKTEDDGVYPSPLNVKAIRLDRIIADPARPAHTYSEQSLADLSQSLLSQGQIMPVLVQYQSDGDVFVLVDGERRWRAAQKAGLETLQAIILGRETPQERRQQRLIAALHVSAWDATERVQALEAFKAENNLATWAEAAQALGISDVTLQTLLQASASADASVAEGDAVTQAMAAMDLLEHALARVKPRQSGKPVLARRLDELIVRLAEQRSKLQQVKSKPQRTETKSPAEGAAKPVRHLPTWDQR